MDPQKGPDAAIAAVKEVGSALLTEYQCCLTDISQLDSDIWQSGAVFLGLSLAGIALLGQADVKTWHDLFSQIGIASIGIILLLIWRRLFHRWLFIIRVDFYRMAEIEAESNDGLWMVRYVDYLGDKSNPSEEPAGEAPKIVALKRVFGGEGHAGGLSVSKHLDWLIWLLLVAWGLLCARAIVSFCLAQ